MQDYGLFKNAEGYTDKTAGNAIMAADTPKAGEIYKTDFGEMLVLKNNGNVCNCLKLLKDELQETIVVKTIADGCSDPRYTNPKMIQYVYTNLLRNYVGKISLQDYTAVVFKVQEALEMNIVPEQSRQQRGYYLDIDKMELEALHGFIKHGMIGAIRDGGADNPDWVVRMVHCLDALQRAGEQGRNEVQ